MGDLELSNRIVMAPMTRARAGFDRVPNELMARYYAQRASAGLIISEATVISEQGIGWQQSPGIYREDQVQGWRGVTDAVHAEGGKIFLQLWHCGRASHSVFHDGALPVSASAIRLEGEGVHTPKGKLPHETPRALETDEVAEVVKDFRSAAARALEAGFDGVEIHAANGYLLDQFLQSKTNHRDDQYGGSIENRLRFLDETVRAVTEVVPAARVGVRIAPNGAFNDMGSPDYRETFLAVGHMLDGRGLAYLHVMDGLGFGFHELGEPMTLAEFRDVFSGPLMGNCGYTQSDGESRIADGHADLAAYGRPFISNPDLVARFAHDWPLAPMADASVWYSFDEKGYADFPTYSAD
jgi:N-ethylmaleimide reductase